MKTDNIHLILDNIYGINTASLIFDYLQHENLVKYIRYGWEKTEISEDMVKSFAYKLIKAISSMHKKNIIHNKLDIENIMMNEKFDPVIIHFSEATLNNGEIKSVQEDFIGFAKILAKLITNGRFSNFAIYPKGTKNILYVKDYLDNSYSARKFWSCFQNISEEFQNFLIKLLTKSKNLNFDDLFEHPWIKNFDNNNKIIEETRQYFQKIYEFNLKNEEECQIENHNYSDVILEEDKNKDNLSLFSNMKSVFDENIYDIFSKMTIETTKFELKGIISDYLLIELFNYDKCSSFFIKFMFKLYTYFELEKNLDKFIISVEKPKPMDNACLSFDININNINNDDHIENLDESNEEDYIVPDELNYAFGEIEQTLIINLELIQYIDTNKKENDKDKFYLVFNYKSGEISYYYHLVKIIKEKAKLVLRSFFNEK
jgi:serine/threonine protein kinase